MPPEAAENDLYEEMCQIEFGPDAPAISRFLRNRHKRSSRSTPREDFAKIVTAVFNNAILVHLRASLWPALEDARQKRELKKEEVTAAMSLLPPMYSRIHTGLATLDNILLLLRPLELELRDLPMPSRGEQTIAGLLSAVPLVKYEALGHTRSGRTNTAAPDLTREDVEWLLHLDEIGDVWLRAFIGRDENAGAVISECLAASIGMRLRKEVSPRSFTELMDLWHAWVHAWERSLAAIPTGKWV